MKTAGYSINTQFVMRKNGEVPNYKFSYKLIKNANPNNRR